MPTISSTLFQLPGQCIESITLDNEHTVVIQCRRDKRRKPIDPRTNQSGTINRYVRRRVRDLPISGHPCVIDIELAQVSTPTYERRIEHCEFVENGARYTTRFCKMISGLCRYMSIHAVSKHLDIRWETVKNIDRAYLLSSLPSLDPKTITGLTHIGVDEVARAKGHDYMTVVYDLVHGHLIWVEQGRQSHVLQSFFTQLPKATAAGIKAVAMDMGQAYQSAVRRSIPNADIVFDRFHVMQNYHILIKKQRRKEFFNSTKEGQKLMKGTLYLLLKNAYKLDGKQSDRLDDLLESNKSLCTIYMMKEQLQALWQETNYEAMDNALEAWCRLAESTNILALHNFAVGLRMHKVGICNYAKYKLTSARIEAGNVSIGMIRRRARGVRDTEYFKLKIRQTSVPATHSIFYPKINLT